MTDQSVGDTPAQDPFRLVLTLGTDHHPFARAVEWVDAWIDLQTEPVDLLAQVGTAPAARHGESHDLLDPHLLAQAMARANAVVSHGGPGTVIDARRAGVEPVVVPRSAALGEHVDDHQQRFARWMSERGRLTVATEQAALHALLDRAMADRDTFRRTGADADRTQVAERFGHLVEGLLA